MRLRLPVLLLLALLSIAGERVGSVNRSQAIFARPLPLDPGDAQRRRVGALTLAGLWELDSANSSFGGLSALLALPGGRFLAVGDSGLLVGFDLHGGHSFIAALPDARGALAGKASDFLERDAESLAADRATGRYWIGYEQKHAIRRFNSGFARRTGLVRPEAMQRWPSNGGAEAIVHLADGRFLAFAEAARADGGGTAGLVWRSDPVEPGPAPEPFRYIAPAGYRVTDGAQLPDGRILLLHRRLAFPRGFSAVLALVDPSDIGPGATVGSRVITRLAPPLTVDNMEGLSILPGPDGPRIFLISDDNFTALQRTLLMEFRMADMTKPEAKAPGFDVLD